MKTIVRHGIALGVLVAIWTFVMGFTGWYKDPKLLNLFWVVIPIEIAVLIVALRHTAAQGRHYGGQVVAGTLVSLIGGLLVIAGSLLFTTVVFPNYFTEIAAIQEEMMLEAGRSEEAVRQAMEAARATNTPIGNAIAGFVGTLITGIVASLAIAAFVRAKGPRAASSAG